MSDIGRRVGLAAGGSLVLTLALALMLAMLPARPAGLAGLFVALAAIPAAAFAGTWAALGLFDQAEATTAARLAALGAPVLVVLTLFVLHVAAPTGAEAPRQLSALVVGVVASSAMGARLSGPQPD